MLLLASLSLSSLSVVDPANMHKDPEFHHFAKFIADHRGGIPYRDELETLARFTAFKGTLRRIEERNAQGHEKHGVTKFADLTPEEFRTKHTGYRPPSHHALQRMAPLDHGVPSNYTLSQSINWATKGALTPMCANARTHAHACAICARLACHLPPLRPADGC